ncbi:hypothetical protein [Priestia megaterium]|nr:hypothetical protein [Priestia megaterium]
MSEPKKEKDYLGIGLGLGVALGVTFEQSWFWNSNRYITWSSLWYHHER